MNRRDFLKAGGALAVAGLGGCKRGNGSVAGLIGGEFSDAPLRDSAEIVVPAHRDNVVIEGLRFRNLGSGAYAIDIRGDNPERPRNIVIKDCLFEDVHWAINVNNCRAVRVHGCRFRNIGQPARFENCRQVQFDYNEVENAGHYPLWGGWWATNMVQFIHCTGPGNSASYNLCELRRGQHDAMEDLISWYNSGGVPGSPAQCIGNRLRGGENSDKAGGILLGDAANTGQYGELSAYIAVRDNTLVDTQSVGIAIAGGHQMEVSDNRILLSRAHNARFGDNVGTGIYAWNYSGSSQCGSHTIRRNRTHVIRGDGSAFDWWNPGDCEPVALSENRFGDESLNDSILPADLFAGLGVAYFSGRRRT